ncbi:EAL domain-containing protein [Klenkia sp. LSe6-5]|uniref:EAL domain-containing protein n=1 Tax=Klenkia sesuvii TaxID=3103137 RepID=A0ABU8DQV2_9ACTN
MTTPDLVTALRAVLAGDPGHGALEVVHQPVVGVAAGTPLGAEALVRWHHPRWGTLPPESFVPVAERAGLGLQLDTHVLRGALGQVAAWDADGVRVHRVGVNLGRTSLHSPALVDLVRQACDLAGALPDRLVVEVVEQHELTLTPARLAGLQALADADVTLALDDFGAGYARVGLLAQLPFGVLKVDRSLLPGPHRAAAPSAPEARRVLAGVVALAGALGLEVTVEGVETAAHHALVTGLGVPHAQGWFYAPAMPADVFADWWRARVATVATAG